MPARGSGRPPKTRLSEAERERQAANLRRRLKRIERELEAIRAQVGESLYTFITRSVEQGKFPIVVPVQDGYCGGCHMKLPLQTLADLRFGGVVQCDNCSRILYDGETN